jgi:ubiquinone/menaquinone biosynthesis C-methylase UbiE
MQLSEAEIQVLASLDKAGLEGSGTDRAALEAGGERFWLFLEDWSAAFQSLAAKGLIGGTEAGFHLTDAGRPLAWAYNTERPDRYWYYYQKFYPAAYASVAHSRLCERAFGRDLCQEGQVDMADLGDLLALLDLRPGDHLLDLGCGAGAIAKYIADETGARVTGLDYAASAIAEARERWAASAERLTFVQGDMNALDFPPHMFDAVISLDTLYWVADLPATLAAIAHTIRPGGRFGIFYEQKKEEHDPPEVLEAGGTELAQALNAVGLAYEATDYTARSAAFWQRVFEAARDLREAFEAEGNGFIAASLLQEADEDFLPGFAAGTITRHLYYLRL